MPIAMPTHRSASHLSALVHLIYEAGIHPERWNKVVEAIAASFGTSKALLFTPFVAPQHGGMIFPTGISEETLQLWGSSYIEHDIWAKQIEQQGLWRAGDVMLDEEMVPHEEFITTRFYQEFLSKIGIARVCAGFVFANDEGLVATSLAVYRDITEPAFDQSDKAWLKLLVSHVSRSMGVMQRLDTASLQKTSLLAAFDRLAFGVVLFDSNMQVLHLNQAAQKVIERRDGLAISAGNQLECDAQPGSRRELSQWLSTIRNASEAEQLHFLDGCRVFRKDGVNQYMIQCSALAEVDAWKAQNKHLRYIAFINDPAALQLPNAERLCTLYGLTKTQAHVALAFAGGESYKDAARSLGISEETVRSHVKEIYPKMRVNRQADLVRLVLSLAQCAV